MASIISPPQAASKTSSATSASPPFPHDEAFKILVADDSAVYRKLLEQTLFPDYSVLLAQTGAQALEIFERERPSLVITDWVMPDLTGLELCQRIRAEAESRYAYVILLTTASTKADVVKGLSAGADDYLTKPFDQEELRARVRTGRRLIELQRQIEAKNRLLEELALTDSLTALPNRRAIEDWAKRQLSGAARHGFPFWVILADLDNFKAINDTYGHATGDIVLKRFADVLRANTRLSDICGRIGGEEFLMVITHVEEANMKMVIERIREQFAHQTFGHDGGNFSVTASFGIAGFHGRTPPPFSQIVTGSDAALYRAKNWGRNRVEMERLAPRG